MLGDKNLDSEEYAMLSTGVYPPIFHSFRKKGIFCFRFFKNFRWRYVLVDNRLFSETYAMSPSDYRHVAKK